MMNNGPRIVMVGGGSHNWCPRLLSDLIQTDDLEGSEVILLDPDLEAATEVQAAGAAMAKHFGKKFRFRATRSETTAFRDADFVIITISTGGLAAMEPDLEIPERYGIYATVGDTVGPGGWSRSMRNVPVFAHLAQTIERLSPNAVILNYTNPMAALTGTIERSCDLRHVGLCHGVFGTYDLLQKLFDVEEKDLCVSFAGVNHFFWVLDFTVHAQPGYPLLRSLLEESTVDQLLKSGATDAHGFHSHHVLCDELFREYGYLGFAHDRHTCEFFPHYLTPTKSVLGRRKLVRTSVADRVAKLAKNRNKTLALAAGKRDPSVRSRETAVDIMCAIAHNEPIHDVVNLPNRGQVANLPRGAVVETMGLVDSVGFRPVAVGEVPPVLEHLLVPHCRVQLLTVEAALNGDRELALQALMMDPQCAHLSPDKVRDMGEALIEANRELLPQFR